MQWISTDLSLRRIHQVAESIGFASTTNMVCLTPPEGDYLPSASSKKTRSCLQRKRDDWTIRCWGKTLSSACFVITGGDGWIKHARVERPWSNSIHSINSCCWHIAIPITKNWVDWSPRAKNILRVNWWPTMARCSWRHSSSRLPSENTLTCSNI